MTTTTTTPRPKIIADARVEFEANSSTALRGFKLEEYVNEALREHGRPLLTKADMVTVFGQVRTDAIQKACAELATNEDAIACSRREYIDETLRQIGQPGITDEEHREFDISV